MRTLQEMNAKNSQPTPQEILALQAVLDGLLATGLVEIKGMRDGKPVYVATEKLRRGRAHISEPPKATQ
jgi:hypothetical protein